MSKNQILEELYEARAKLLAEHGGSLTEYLKAAAERAKSSNHPVAQIEQRMITRKPASPPLDVVIEQTSSPPVQR